MKNDIDDKNKISNEEDNYVNLSNKWFKNDDGQTLLEQYGEEAMTVYMLLMRDMSYNQNIVIMLNSFNLDMGIIQSNTNMVNKIKKAFYDLDNNLIMIYDDSRHRIKTTKMKYGKPYHIKILVDLTKDKYFQVYSNDIGDALEYVSKEKKSTNKFAVCVYLAFLSFCMGNKKGEDNYKICYPSIDYSAKVCGYSPTSIMRYNKILIDSKVIVVGNVGTVKSDNNTYIDIHNTYARHINKEYLITSINKQKDKLKTYTMFYDKKELQNKSRGKAQEITKWKKKHDLDNLTEEEFNELHILEKEHYDIRIDICGKGKINNKYLTLTNTKNE